MSKHKIRVEVAFETWREVEMEVEVEDDEDPCDLSFDDEKRAIKLADFDYDENMLVGIRHNSIEVID